MLFQPAYYQTEYQKSRKVRKEKKNCKIEQKRNHRWKEPQVAKLIIKIQTHNNQNSLCFNDLGMYIVMVNQCISFMAWDSLILRMLRSWSVRRMGMEFSKYSGVRRKVLDCAFLYGNWGGKELL